MHLVSRAGQGFARRGAADHQRPCLADIAMRAVGQLDAVPAADFPDEPRAVAGAQAAEDGGIGRRSFAHEHRARHALARHDVVRRRARGAEQAEQKQDAKSQRTHGMSPYSPLPSLARGEPGGYVAAQPVRSEEHTSELQSLMRISYAVFCLKKKK